MLLQGSWQVVWMDSKLAIELASHRNLNGQAVQPVNCQQRC